MYYITKMNSDNPGSDTYALDNCHHLLSNYDGSKSTTMSRSPRFQIKQNMGSQSHCYDIKSIFDQKTSKKNGASIGYGTK